MILSIKKNSLVFSRPILLVLFALLMLYFILGLFGYGSDNDTYWVLLAGRNWWINGTYTYSRVPGYLIPEIIIGGASLIGGYILPNWISAILGTATLYMFWQLIKKGFSDFNALLITLIIGLNPYYVIASSSSVDYVYSLFFCMAGIQLLTKRRIFVAALLFAFAGSSRLSSLLIIGIIYLYYLYIRYKEHNYKEITYLFLSGCLLALLTIVLYIPSYMAIGSNFGFFHYKIGDWTFFGHLSRFIYKNIYLFGLLPFIFISAIITSKIVKHNLPFPFTPQIYAGLAIVLVLEILFFKIPCEISYLLPILFVVIPLFVIFCQPRKITMYILVVLSILYGFIVNIDFLDRKFNVIVGVGYEAIDAKVGVFMRHGAVIDDVLLRKETERIYGPRSLMLPPIVKRRY